MKLFTMLMAIAICMAANVRMKAQTPSDNKLWYASHAGDFPVNCRVNFYVFSASPITIDSLALVESLERLNDTWNGSTQQTIGGITTGPQMIPTNIHFQMNAIINIADPSTYNLANWEDYMLYYDSMGFWHHTHFVDDADSIIDVVMVRNTLHAGPYSTGHMGKGVTVINLETGDMDQYDMAKEMAHVFGMHPSHGSGDPIFFGTDFIPDTPVENGMCGDTLHPYCTNNIMGTADTANYFSPMQTGWLRKIIISDSMCVDDLEYGEYICFDMVNDFPLGDYDIHRFWYTGGFAGVENEAQTPFSVYPNPTTDYITVSGAVGGTIEIYNLGGQLIQKVLNYRGAPIQVSQHKPGVYLVRYGSATKKIVIS